MGANLALNLADSGNRVAVYNRTTSVTDEFMKGEASKKEMSAASTLEGLVGLLDRPRVILLMVKAGAPVDAVIDELSHWSPFSNQPKAYVVIRTPPVANGRASLTRAAA